MSTPESQPVIGEGFTEQEEDFYKLLELETFLASLNGADENYLSSLIETLNAHTRSRRRQPIGIDSLVFINPEKPDEITDFPIADEDVVVGRFEEFLLHGESKPRVAVRMFVNITPDISPGIFREEILPLWNEDERALRWPNFDYQPRPKPKFWYRLLRMA